MRITSKMIDDIYNEYTMYINYEEGKRVFFRTLKAVNNNLYYAMQKKIFVELNPKYRDMATWLADDMLEYLGKFDIKYIEWFIDELDFMNVSDDVKKRNKARWELLKDVWFEKEMWK